MEKGASVLRKTSRLLLNGMKVESLFSWLAFHMPALM